MFFVFAIPKDAKRREAQPSSDNLRPRWREDSNFSLFTATPGHPLLDKAVRGLTSIPTPRPCEPYISSDDRNSRLLALWTRLKLYCSDAYFGIRARPRIHKRSQILVWIPVPLSAPRNDSTIHPHLDAATPIRYVSHPAFTSGDDCRCVRLDLAFGVAPRTTLGQRY